MNNVEEKLMKVALRNLQLCRLQYAVENPDGGYYGTLRVLGDDEIAVPKPTTKKRTRDAHRFDGVDIAGFIANMAVADVRVFDCSKFPHLTVDQLQRNIGAWGSHTYGTGNFATARNGHLVEVMRLG